MHEHNLDLIMALAEGTLDASDASSAEAEIAACAECAEDLELQRLALGALADAPPVHMTEMESGRMRRALREDLGLIRAAPPVRAQRRWFPMGALAGAAALFLALVIVGPGLNLLGSGGDDASDTVSFAAEAPTTTVPAAGMAADESAGGENDTTLRDSEEAASDGTDTPQPASITTTAAPETTTTSAAAETPALLDFAGQPNLVTLRDTIIELGITADTDLTQYGNQLRSAGYLFSFRPPDDTDDTESCIAAGLAAIDGANSGYALGYTPYDGGEALLAVYETGTAQDIVVAALDPTSCIVLNATP